VQTLAWPLVVLLVIVAFRRQLAYFIGELQEVQGPAGIRLTRRREKEAASDLTAALQEPAKALAGGELDEEQRRRAIETIIVSASIAGVEMGRSKMARTPTRTQCQSFAGRLALLRSSAGSPASMSCSGSVAGE
jgi:hypothetical protein